MGHPVWCGKPCAECERPCAIDEAMPCSPDCAGLDHKSGEPKGGNVCKGCDAQAEAPEQ